METFITTGLGSRVNPLETIIGIIDRQLALNLADLNDADLAHKVAGRDALDELEQGHHTSMEIALLECWGEFLHEIRINLLHTQKGIRQNGFLNREFLDEFIKREDHRMSLRIDSARAEIGRPDSDRLMEEARVVVYCSWFARHVHYVCRQSVVEALEACLPVKTAPQVFGSDEDVWPRQFVAGLRMNREKRDRAANGA